MRTTSDSGVEGARIRWADDEQFEEPSCWDLAGVMAAEAQEKAELEEQAFLALSSGELDDEPDLVRAVQLATVPAPVRPGRSGRA